MRCKNDNEPGANVALIGEIYAKNGNEFSQ
jgi:hypothetical protein